jgi:hypothetical protein
VEYGSTTERGVFNVGGGGFPSLDEAVLHVEKMLQGVKWLNRLSRGSFRLTGGWRENPAFKRGGITAVDSHTCLVNLDGDQLPSPPIRVLLARAVSAAPSSRRAEARRQAASQIVHQLVSHLTLKVNRPQRCRFTGLFASLGVDGEDYPAERGRTPPISVPRSTVWLEGRDDGAHGAHLLSDAKAGGVLIKEGGDHRVDSFGRRLDAGIRFWRRLLRIRPRLLSNATGVARPRERGCD